MSERVSKMLDDIAERLTQGKDVGLEESLEAILWGVKEIHEATHPQPTIEAHYSTPQPDPPPAVRCSECGYSTYGNIGVCPACGSQIGG